MNDRVSKRPPSLYTREDDSMEYSWSHSHTARPPRNYVDTDGTDGYKNASVDIVKPSGMYRFGRAIVNAFKPVAGWRGYTVTRDEKERQIYSGKGIMQERKVKAEKAYAELKKNDFEGLQTSLNVSRNIDKPAIKCEIFTDEVRPALHRDSGVDMKGYRPLVSPSQDDKQSHIKAQPIPSSKVSTVDLSRSPIPEASTTRKSSMHLRKPSSQSLKKAKSHVQLPSAKKYTVPMVPGICTNLEGITGAVAIDHSLRKMPSRKDIAKQQKLSKRVSDLENQLEIARRDLQLSINEAQAYPEIASHKRVKSFKPGALPSLPSESILKTQGSDGKDIRSNRVPLRSPFAIFYDKQVRVKSEENNIEATTIDPATKLYGEPDKPDYLCNVSNKRKDSPGNVEAPHKLGCKPSDEEALYSTGETSPKRKVKPSLNTTENGTYPIDADVGSTVNKQRSSSKESKQNEAEPIPPLPATLAFFDPALVDQAKIISMRSSCDMKTPFGKDADDMMNLRKEYPTITDSQFWGFWTSLSKNGKTTDHTSLSHHNQPLTPLLQPPRCTSPVRAEPFKHTKNRAVKVESCHDLARSSSVSTHGIGSKAVRSESLSKNQPLSPNLSMANANSKLDIEKPLPTLQKEDYEWPDDVF